MGEFDPLDLLNPCKMVQYLQRGICLVILFFIGGYVGKYLIQKTDFPEQNFIDRLETSQFWIPDGWFWLSGLVAAVGFVLCYWVILAFVESIKKILGFLLCELPCCCCNFCLWGECSRNKRNQNEDMYHNLEYNKV